MRRTFLLSFVLGLLLVPGFAEAASATFFGPIVPEICRTCACGFGGVLAIIQNVTNFIISMAVIIATIIIAWGGFLYITSSTNPESRSTANKMLINAIIGLMIVLSAWLIVDFVMKTFYGGQFGPWNSILVSGSGSACVEAVEIAPLFSGNIIATPGEGHNGGATTDPDPNADGRFTYDPGIEAQYAQASFPLRNLLTCIAQRVPANAGRISSISDSQIVSGRKSWAQCQASGCNHSANSCHYGGSACTGSSYAVDFGDEENMAVLQAAATACGAATLNEGNHLHVSIGAANNCGCRI